MDTPLEPNALKRRLLTLFLVVLACVAVDRVSKSWAEDNLDPHLSKSYLADTFRIQYAENTGAFLGMGKDWNKMTRFLIFSAATSVFLIFVAVTTLRHPKLDRIELIAVSLIVGGGVGNLIDRFVRADGSVVDFMNMGIGGLRTGIFNVADVALTAGLIIWILPRKKKEDGEGAPTV
ncbi:MAG: signal peptidase II [Planctomycetes bacterium]|jgi:signal peptidase II|nr:signal peptidase II [Planctomycetota bacterium]